jgi:leucyl aminopeptidase
MAEAKVTVVRAAAEDIRAPLLAFFRFQDAAVVGGVLSVMDSALTGAVRRVLERGDFQGRKDEAVLLYGGGEHAPERLVLVGLGKKDDFTPQALRRAVGHAVRQAERVRVREIGLVLDGLDTAGGESAHALAVAAAEAAVMAAWDWRDLKTMADPPPVNVAEVRLFALDDAQHALYQAAVAHGETLGRAANFARDLAIRPGNIATPSYLAGAARTLADRFGMKLTVLNRADMEREGMKAILAVAQGSEEEPRFIVLEHRTANAGKPLALIGKGVTFDSGGISIKPADRMEDMKFDMSGAAGVLGAMQGIAELGIAADVVAIVPSTENLPSGRAMKPGDVIGSLLGKTIEIVNTDAEGRLILADALAYARRLDPAAMVNAATLTGAVGIALGHHAIGLMGNDETLMEEVRAAGERTGERCWPLPLWDEYRPQIDSPVADMKNTGGRPAGSITAGWFLKEFAGEVPWVHLDIAATAYRDEPAPYLRKGPTGLPTRLLIEWVRGRVLT